MKIVKPCLRVIALICLCSAYAAPLFAQTLLPCADLQQGLGFEVGIQDSQAIERLQVKVKKLQACVEAMQFDMSIHNPRLMVDQIDDNRKTLITLTSKLYQTENRLAKAELKIEMLDLRLSALEPKINKFKVPSRKPAPDFVPDSPAPTAHPVSKRSDSNKPTSSTNKLTPATK